VTTSPSPPAALLPSSSPPPPLRCPGTPLHASAAQALRRRPPRDATRAELARDAVLRFLSRRVWAYAAVAWLGVLVGWIVWIVILHIGILLPYPAARLAPPTSSAE